MIWSLPDRLGKVLAGGALAAALPRPARLPSRRTAAAS